MLDKCANPGCTAVLHRLRDGRLFAFDPQRLRGRTEGLHLVPRSSGNQYHWLCNECCKTLTLSCNTGVVTVVPKEPALPPSLRPHPVRAADPPLLERAASNL